MYFDPVSGKPNLRVLTLQTLIFIGFYANAYLFSVGQARDDSMIPYMRKAGFPFSDTIFYRKFTQPNEKLQNKIVAVKDPFKLNHIVFRRVVAEENQWIQRKDDGGIIKVPKGHVWIECENENERSVDSLTDEIGGPVSKKFVIGAATGIIWPLWRRTSFSDLEKYKPLLQKSKDGLHSKVYTNEEIFRKYGVR